jgi:hypothetical protein
MDRQLIVDEVGYVACPNMVVKGDHFTQFSGHRNDLQEAVDDRSLTAMAFWP